MGCRNEGAQRGREERFHELTGMWQKELYGGEVMNGQPMKLSEDGRDVFIFPTFCDSFSCCILCCLQTLNLCLGQASKKTITIVQL